MAETSHLERCSDPVASICLIPIFVWNSLTKMNKSQSRMVVIAILLVFSLLYLINKMDSLIGKTADLESQINDRVDSIISEANDLESRVDDIESRIAN